MTTRSQHFPAIVASHPMALRVLSNREMRGLGLGLWLLFSFFILGVSDAWSSPTMIRLGYTSCAVCHLSAQGGGLLTDYGKGIDLAQSLFAREYVPPPDAGARRFLQDVRILLGVQRNSEAGAPATQSPGLQIWHRAAWLMTSHQKLTSVTSMDAYPAQIGPSKSRPAFALNRFTWDFKAADGVDLSIGKDALPTALGTPDYYSFLGNATEPGVSASPAQVKLFWLRDRFQLTPYAFGPGGEAGAERQFGAGLIGGIELPNQHAVIGATARSSTTPLSVREGGSVYARLGFGRWGIFSEHELGFDTSRMDGSPATQYFGGNTVLFVAPYEWLVTSLSAQYFTADRTTRYAYRLSPAVQVRVSDKLTFVVSNRATAVESATAFRRNYAVQVFMKTVR